ncbi:hypothetical protein [Streptomyces sp. NBC_00019]|uniref:hypothetical protein n=1 Tax=Streptomyces sp. NBC_00019 TaxID=2975623 RepID=UPI00324BEB1D
MTYFFRLTRVPDAPCPSLLYKAEVDGSYEVFLVLDEQSRSIRPSDSNGNAILSGTSEEQDAIRGFTLLAAHLAAEWEKLGRPPQEIRKVFG